MLYHVTIGDRTLAVELDGSRVVVDGREIEQADLSRLEGTDMRSLLMDGASSVVTARPAEGGWDLQVDGWPLHAAVVDERTRAIRAMTGQGAGPQGPKPVRAPMPGLIVRVEVEVGDTVRAGQGIVVMEAMKMENELKAESGGIVSRISAEPGAAVQKGAVLVEFEAAP
jgi:biotin carboxyl carrier protein